MEEPMNVEITHCSAVPEFAEPLAPCKRRTFMGRDNDHHKSSCNSTKRRRIHPTARRLPPSGVRLPRSAPPQAHLYAGPRTPKSQAKAFSSEPSPMASTQFGSVISCSATPAAPLDDRNVPLSFSDPSGGPSFGVSHRVSWNKLSRADPAFTLGSRPKGNSLTPFSTQHIFRFDGTLGRQPSPPCKVRWHTCMQHPSLEAVSQVGAELLLKDRPIGAFVFRPGSHMQCMFLSWKTGKRSITHSKITFDPPRSQDRQLQAPPKLHLQRELYKDLYEIESHYIIPLAGYARALFSHSSFRATQGVEQVFKALFERHELQADAAHQQPFIIAPFHRRPGPHCHSFIVAFIKDSEPVKIRFQLTPKGYVVLGRRCTTPDMIVHYLMEIGAM